MWGRPMTVGVSRTGAVRPQWVSECDAGPPAQGAAQQVAKGANSQKRCDQDRQVMPVFRYEDPNHKRGDGQDRAHARKRHPDEMKVGPNAFNARAFLLSLLLPYRVRSRGVALRLHSTFNNCREQTQHESQAFVSRSAISITRTPALRARRTMSAVPLPPGKATTRSGLPSTSIC